MQFSMYRYNIFVTVDVGVTYKFRSKMGLLFAEKYKIE